MANLNKVFLMGNLTRDIELKSTQGGQSVAKIGLAINRRWRSPEGEQREETTFVDCEAWGKTAETMAKYLAKGRPVFIEGRLKLDQWQDKESGQNRSKMGVVVESFQFIDARGQTSGGGGEGEDAGASSGGGGGGRSSGGGGGGNGGGGGGGWSQTRSGGGNSGGGGGKPAPRTPANPPPMGDDDIPF